MSNNKLNNPENPDIKTENPEKDESVDKPKQEISRKKLTQEEIRKLDNKEVTMPELVAEKKRFEQAAKDELANLTKKKDLIDLKEYKNLKEEIEETESPQLLEKLVEKIKKIPKDNEKQKEKDKEEEKILPPDHEKLLELQNKFNQICDKNKHLIGLKEVAGFKAWFAEERKKNPTIKYLKEQIRRLEGKEVYDREGLAPRREEFQKLSKIFQKYGFSSPLKSPWIEKEGLSERKQFRENAEDLQNHFQKMQDTGFYSKEAIEKNMKQCLESPSPLDQKKLINQAKNIARTESENFTYLNSTMTVNGITVKKMSDSSKQKYLDYYKDSNLKEREKMVSDWQELVENEAKLTKNLAEIYKNDPDSLKFALKSFGELDFMEKEKALKEHKKLVEGNEKKEEVQKRLILKAAFTHIDKAANQGIIAKGENKTQGRYKKFFENENNFKNPNNDKKGDIKEMEKALNILIDPNPQEKYKNLAAYKKRKKTFEKDLKNLEDINPEIEQKELNEIQKEYENTGWTAREKIHQKLQTQINKEKKEQNKKRALEEKIGIKEKKEESKTNPELNETLKTVQELLNDEQAAEAMKLLLEYNETDPDNAKILFWIETVARYMKEFGTGEKTKENMEEKIEQEMDRVIEEDEQIKDNLEEENIIRLNIEGSKQSEERHQGKNSARERAKKESLQKTSGDEMEKELTEDYYEQTDKAHILNEDKTGEKIDEIKFTTNKMDDLEKQHLKSETYRKQGKLIDKEGFTHIKLEDENGREISSEEAEAQQQKNLETLEKNISEKTIDKIERKTGNKKSADIFSISERMANERAKKRIDKEINKKLEAA